VAIQDGNLANNLVATGLIWSGGGRGGRQCVLSSWVWRARGVSGGGGGGLLDQISGHTSGGCEGALLTRRTIDSTGRAVEEQS